MIVCGKHIYRLGFSVPTFGIKNPKVLSYYPVKAYRLLFLPPGLTSNNPTY
jgi:hypothetical protein